MPSSESHYNQLSEYSARRPHKNDSHGLTSRDLRYKVSSSSLSERAQVNISMGLEPHYNGLVDCTSSIRDIIL